MEDEDDENEDDEQQDDNEEDAMEDVDPTSKPSSDSDRSASTPDNSAEEDGDTDDTSMSDVSEEDGDENDNFSKSIEPKVIPQRHSPVERNLDQLTFEICPGGCREQKSESYICRAVAFEGVLLAGDAPILTRRMEPSWHYADLARWWSLVLYS